MISWAEEVGTILAKLRVAKCQELVMPVSNLDAIEECSVDTSKEFVVSLLVGTSVDTTLSILALTTRSADIKNLKELICKLHAKKSTIFVLTSVVSKHSIRRLNGRGAEVDRAWCNCCLARISTIVGNICF